MGKLTKRYNTTYYSALAKSNVNSLLILSVEIFLGCAERATHAASIRGRQWGRSDDVVDAGVGEVRADAGQPSANDQGAGRIIGI